MSSCSSDSNEETAPPLRLVVGDELGVLRVAEVPSNGRWEKTKVIRTWGSADKQRAIQTLAVSSQTGHAEESVVCLSRRDGQVEVLNGADFEVSTTISHPNCTEGAGMGKRSMAVFLKPWWNDSNRLRLLACYENGVVRMHEESNLESDSLTESLSMKEVWEIDACKNITTVSCDPVAGCLTVGGQGRDCILNVWDLQSQQMRFKAAPPPNPYKLPRQYWTTACAEIPGTQSNVFAVGTADHAIQLYDARTGQEPVFKMTWKESRVSCMMPENGNEVWMGNGAGFLERFDVKKRTMRGSLKGLIAGSVRALDVHSERKLLASVSLDKYMRIHDTVSKTLKAKVYVKYQPTSVAYLPLPKDYEDPAETSEDEEDGEKLVDEGRKEVPSIPSQKKRTFKPSVSSVNMRKRGRRTKSR